MKLFTPITIGNMTVKNRWVMSPMTTNYADEQTQGPSPRLIQFLEQRAKGGVGLITVEVCTVDVKAKYQPQSMTLGCDEVIAAHRQLTDTLHRYDVKIQPQLTHPGPEAMSLFFWGEPAVGPSPGVGACHGLPCRELSIDELDSIVEAYGESARRARKAGYDGVELHAAHAYMLLGAFLSPLKNKRQDEYGADTPDNRIRLLTRVIRRIKQLAGADFPITLRISGFERIPGGRGSDDTAVIAPALVEAGVDAFHISGGVSDPMVAQMVCGPDVANGYNLPVAEALRRVVDVPVMVVGRIHDPQFAESILQNNQADMIVMGRPFLADPDIVNKTRAGQWQQIRRCISCQTCIDSMFLKPFDADMHCAVNAATGREAVLHFQRAEQAKKVVVIGSGPGGMEAARVACARGHHVTLLEQSRHLGGSLMLAATVHQDNQYLLDYLCSEIRRLPISVQLGVAATVDRVKALAPDAVIVASGARLTMPDISGLDSKRVITGQQLRDVIQGVVTKTTAGLPQWLQQGVKWFGPMLDRYLTAQRIRLAAKLWLPVGKRVTIIGGDLAAIELAEFLARRRRQVTLLNPGDSLAPEIGPKRRLEHELRLEKYRVSINSHVRCKAIRDEGVELFKAGNKSFIQPADTVIVTGSPAANTTLFDALSDAGLSCHAVGDCTGLGLIDKAIYDGNRVAHQL